MYRKELSEKTTGVMVDHFVTKYWSEGPYIMYIEVDRRSARRSIGPFLDVDPLCIGDDMQQQPIGERWGEEGRGGVCMRGHALDWIATGR